MTTRIRLETEIEAPPQLVFDAARDIDLHVSSMRRYRERRCCRSDEWADRSGGDGHLEGASPRRMIGVWEHELSAGCLGRIADRLIIRRKLLRLLEERAREVKAASEAEAKL